MSRAQFESTLLFIMLSCQGIAFQTFNENSFNLISVTKYNEFTKTMHNKSYFIVQNEVQHDVQI